MYHKFLSLYSLYEGKERAKKIYISLAFLNYSNKSQHAVDYLFGSIANLVLVPDDCDDGTPTLHDFVYSRLGISILI
jgi:hypothetical protein